MTPEQMRTLRGPMLLRTEGEQASTFDQRLLESGADHEWQHADPWRVLRRKTMFLKYSQAFICLPGGMGTMDEFFEVMCMVQTGKVTNYPIVLMGTEYWTGLLEWMDKTLAAGGFINESDRELFLLTDDPDEAVSHIIKRHEVMSDKRIREPR